MIVGVVAVAIAVIAFWPEPQPEEAVIPSTTTVTEPETAAGEDSYTFHNRESVCFYNFKLFNARSNFILHHDKNNILRRKKN